MHKPLHKIWETPQGVAAVVALAVADMGMVPFLYIEACTVAEYSFRGWLNVRTVSIRTPLPILPDSWALMMSLTC